MAVVQKEVNPRFEDFLFEWTTKLMLLVGGYGSSKSYHTALKIILKLLEEKRTGIVVRDVYGTHKDSTISLFEEILVDLDMLDHRNVGRVTPGKVRLTKSPYELKFSNGSKLLFKGLDNPAKLKSINNISLIWIEECSEITYEAFKELLGRLRHPTLKLHMILTTNPVSMDNWTFSHFFYDELEERHVLDDEELYEKKTVVTNDTYYHFSTADDNVFLPQSYIDQLDELAEYDPDLHRIARLGRFGINGVRVLPQIEIAPRALIMDEIHKSGNTIKRNGLDFGFIESYNALSKMTIDTDRQWLFITDEYYKKGLTDPEILDDLKDHLELGEYDDRTGSVVGGEKVVADYEPKAIKYYRQHGINMMGARKGPNSRIQNTKKAKRFKKILIAEECKNHVRELKSLTFAIDKNGKTIEDEFNIDPHTFSALWYGIEDYHIADVKHADQKEGRPKRERVSRSRRRA